MGMLKCVKQMLFINIENIILQKYFWYTPTYEPNYIINCQAISNNIKKKNVWKQYTHKKPFKIIGKKFVV